MMISEEDVDRKQKRVCQPPVSLFSSLPDEIIENILARVSRWSYPSLSLVSKKFHSLLTSPQIYKTRSLTGSQQRCVYVSLKCPDQNPSWFILWTKPLKPHGDGSILGFSKDPMGASVVPAPFPSFRCFPLARNVQEVGSEIYICGGSHKSPSSSLCILDCRSHTLREGPNMRVAREDPFVFLVDNKEIYVLGGCSFDELNWFEVFDLKTQSWTAFTGPGPIEDYKLRNILRETDKCAVVEMLEGKLYIATNYERDYTYDTKDSTWKLVRENSSFLSDMLFWTAQDNIIYGLHCFGYLVWSDTFFANKDREWREINGLEELCDQCLNTGGWRALKYYDEKLVVMWDPYTSDSDDDECSGIKRENQVFYYAKISLEKRSSSSNGREVWGKVECVDVLTFPGQPYNCNGCFNVTV